MNYLYILLFFIGFNMPSENYKLTLSIDNIEETKGTIEVAVFNKPDGFLGKDKAFKTYSIPATSNSVVCEIDNLPKGEYAISLYHDTNSDGKVNLNFIGIPKEPYGFSNNIKPRFSAPSYDDCKFSFVSHKKLQISLID